MAENSNIEWTEHTVNLWWGCAKVHDGCKNCYAETLSNRFGDDVWGENTPRKLIKSAFKDLNKFQRNAKKQNKIEKVFVGSMMDIFEKPKPLIGLREEYVTTSDLRNKLFDEISDGKYPNLVFLFLTKRPENIVSYIPFDWIDNPPKNVWFGTSVSSQKTVSAVNFLTANSTAKLFLSIEPQIDEISKIDLTYIDWVIQGGESGNKKRPFKIEWAEQMRDICDVQNTPFFFKQIDKVQKVPSHLMIKEYPNFN